MLHADQRLFQGQVTGGLASRGLQRGAARADVRVVELDLRAVLERNHQRMQGVGPALDGVAHVVVTDRQVVLRGAGREARQQGDVVLLHRKTDAAAAEEEVEVFAKIIQPVDVREAAVEHAAVVAHDRFAAELHRAHAGQHLLGRHLREGLANDAGQIHPAPRPGQQVGLGAGQLRDVRREFRRQPAFELGGEKLQVHVADALDALGENLAAAQFRPVAGVLRHRDVVGQPVVGVLGQPALGVAGPVQHVGPRHFPMAAARNRLFHRVLHLLDGGMPAVAVMELEHLRDAGGDARDLGEIGTLQTVAGQGVVAVGIRGVVRADLMKRQGDGASDLAQVETHTGAVALGHQAFGGGYGPAEQLGALALNFLLAGGGGFGFFDVGDTG